MLKQLCLVILLVLLTSSCSDQVNSSEDEGMSAEDIAAEQAYWDSLNKEVEAIKAQQAANGGSPFPPAKEETITDADLAAEKNIFGYYLGMPMEEAKAILKVKLVDNRPPEIEARPDLEIKVDGNKSILKFEDYKDFRGYVVEGAKFAEGVDGKLIRIQGYIGQLFPSDPSTTLNVFAAELVAKFPFIRQDALSSADDVVEKEVAGLNGREIITLTTSTIFGQGWKMVIKEQWDSLRKVIYFTWEAN